MGLAALRQGRAFHPACAHGDYWPAERVLWGRQLFADSAHTAKLLDSHHGGELLPIVQSLRCNRRLVSQAVRRIRGRGRIRLAMSAQKARSQLGSNPLPVTTESYTTSCIR